MRIAYSFTYTIHTYTHTHTYNPKSTSICCADGLFYAVKLYAYLNEVSATVQLMMVHDQMACLGWRCRWAFAGKHSTNRCQIS